MPFGTYETPKLPVIVTFLQYIKTAHKGVEGKTKFTVDVIWLPGKFDNVTLQTHAFRYICDPNHPLYTEVKNYCEGLVSRVDSPRLQIVIDSIQERKISVVEDVKTKGVWEKLGTNAYKYKNP